MDALSTGGEGRGEVVSPHSGPPIQESINPPIPAMSYFRVALQRETERRKLQQGDLAKSTGLSRSYISRLLSGDSADLSPENFGAILKVFAADKRAQAELIAARCMDAKAGADGTPGNELVQITIKDAGKPAERQVELP